MNSQSAAQPNKNSRSEFTEKQLIQNHNKRFSLRVHNGVHFLEHSKTPVDVKGTVTHGGKHFILSGPLAVVEIRNSWKYGHELHITVHCSPLFVVAKKANPTEWSRIEIALPFNLGVQTLARALDNIHEGGEKA